MTDREQRLFDALKRIAAYMTPDQLRRKSERLYGLGYEEVLEMTYENVLQEARNATRGMRRPRAAAPAAGGGK